MRNKTTNPPQGYHVQITARSDTDLEPATILQKVSDASGAKYTAGGSAPAKPSGPPPPVKTKPLFAGVSGPTNPIIAARNANLKKKDDDGWGEDAPPVTRSEIQKVQSAYQPTKVNMAELTGQKQEPSRFNGAAREDPSRSDVVGGSYQPVGKVDIAAIRAAAKEKQDDRPVPVKGAYEPVGKVDIAAIKAQSQRPSEDAAPETRERQPSVSERSAAFQQSERLTELPKPKVAKKWGGAATFTGTKAPTPGAYGFGGPSPAPGAPPVGSASRTFADQGGKTPAQLWAEKKAAQGGKVISPTTTGTGPISPQTSGNTGWQSGYTGKSWAPVQTPSYSRGIPGQKTGDTTASQEKEAPASPSGGISSIRDRFNEAPPPQPSPSSPGIPQASVSEDRGAPPPPMASRPPPDASSAPTGATGGFALPGMPPRPPPATEEEEEERAPSPIQVAVPVARGPEPEIEPAHEPPRSLPTRTLEREVPREEQIPAEAEAIDPRAAATAVAVDQFGQARVDEAPAATSGGHRALIQYDYEKAEDNEIELREGEYVTNIDMVDEDWWMGTNSRGEIGLFPSNYVELVDDGAAAAPAQAPAAAQAQQAIPSPAAPAPVAVEAEPEPEPSSAHGYTATAEFDYEAAEDNGMLLPIPLSENFSRFVSLVC